MQLRSAPINNIDLSFTSLNIGQLLQNNSVLTWVNNYHLYILVKWGILYIKVFKILYSMLNMFILV